MLVDIDRIVVNDRIRKDFGDIQELAEDIRTNGLINPPTVNKDYVLLAGERRLRACKSLGWTQIEVHMLDTRDEAHDLAVEMSENNMRRNFTGSELADGIRRQMELESAKARERMAEGGRGANISTPSGKTRDKAAEHFGISGEQARKTVFVDEHRELLDPTDFAEWDEGKLSTNKAYQRIKAALEQAERERDDARETVGMVKRVGDELKRQRDEAREEVEQLGEDIGDLQREVAALEAQSDKAYEDGYKAAQSQQGQAPKVVERRVEVPSAADQRRIKELEHLEQLHSSDNAKLRRKLEEARQELDKAKLLIGEKQRDESAQWDIAALTTATNNYLRQYGGKAWAFDQFYRVDETTQAEFVKAINNLAAFAQNLAEMIREQSNE